MVFGRLEPNHICGLLYARLRRIHREREVRMRCSLQTLLSKHFSALSCVHAHAFESTVNAVIDAKSIFFFDHLILARPRFMVDSERNTSNSSQMKYAISSIYLDGFSCKNCCSACDQHINKRVFKCIPLPSPLSSTVGGLVSQLLDALSSRNCECCA